MALRCGKSLQTAATFDGSCTTTMPSLRAAPSVRFIRGTRFPTRAVYVLHQRRSHMSTTTTAVLPGSIATFPVMGLPASSRRWTWTDTGRAPSADFGAAPSPTLPVSGRGGEGTNVVSSRLVSNRGSTGASPVAAYPTADG